MFLKRSNFIYLLIMSLFLLSCNSKNKNELSFETFIFNRNKTIPIVSFDSKKDKQLKLIIDTGSEINIINKNYYDDNQCDFVICDSINNIIKTVNGEINNSTYIVSTTLNDSININFYVLEMSDIINNLYLNQQVMTHGLLGIDFMYENNITIDFKNKEIEIKK